MSPKQTLAIARKELGIYLTTPVGYIGFGTFAFLLGLLFTGALNKYQQYTEFYLGQQRPDLLDTLNFNDAILLPTFNSALWMLLFFVPFLTMRLFAEERSEGTLELLLTSPIRAWDIVLGKFLSLVAMMVVYHAIQLLFPLILELYGSGPAGHHPVEWAPIWSGIAVTLLFGIGLSTLGMLLSSMTRSQVTAALLTFTTLLLVFTLPLIASRVDGIWREVMDYAAPITHVSEGLQGRIRLTDLIYFVSSTVALLFLTSRVVESYRWR
jgi:ABC-2 type transport system permease protein